MASLSTETITAMQSVFTPGSGCHKSWTYEGESYNSVEGGLLIQNLDAYDFASSCFPEDFGMYGRAPSSIQVYSPGACPSGYATPGQFNNDGTTTGICCPSSYSYGSTYSSINYYGSSSVLFLGCISQFRGTTKLPARANDTDLTTTQISASGDGITMWAQPITIEYQQKDLQLFGLTSSTAAPTGRTISNSASLPSATASLTSTPASASSTSSSTAASASSGLSTGAKAGIGIGVALGLFLLLAIGAFLLVKRRKNKRRERTHPYIQDGKEPYRQPQWERSEMDAVERERKVELDASTPRRQRTVQEMEG